MSPTLIARLEAMANAFDRERGCERAGPVRRTTLKRGDLHQEGDQVGAISVIAEGLGYRHKHLPNGRRQIVGYLLPGDVVGYGMQRGAILDYSVRLMQPSVLYTIHPADLPSHQESLFALLLCVAARDLSVSLEWISTVGQRDAKARVAHLFCELYYRMQDVGLLRNAGFDFPASQEEIADSVGITTVHANRTLQGLRREGLVTFDSRTLVVRDIAALVEIAMFSPDYLHLAGPDASRSRRPSGLGCAEGLALAPDR